MLTFPCTKESFLPHFGHLPSNLCMISSGGVNSMPSYRTEPHFWHCTLWGMFLGSPRFSDNNFVEANKSTCV